MSEGERPAVDFRVDRAAGWRQFPPAPHRVSDTRAYRHLNEQLLLVSRDGSDGTGEVRVTALDGSKWRELPAPGGSGELPTELNGLLAFASAAPGGGTMPVEILGSDLVWRPLASGTRNDVESPPLNLLGPTSSYYPSLYGQVLDIWMADLVTMPDPPGRLLELRHPTTVAVGTDLFVFGGDVVRGSASVPTNESFLFHAPVWIPADD